VYLISHDIAMQNNLSEFIKDDAAAIVGGLTLLLGIGVAILLLPSLSSFKMGPAEFVTAIPSAITGTVIDSEKPPPPLPMFPADLIKKPPESEMPIESKTERFTMPLKYQRQRFIMPFDVVKMPIKSF
jgi:hypothetical protein